MSFTVRRRRLALITTAKSVSWLGDQLAVVAMMLRLQGNGAGPAAVAALLVADLVPLVLLAPVAGRLVDRIDNGRLIAVSSAAQTVTCAVLAYTDSPAAALALVALLGAGQAVVGPAWQAVIASLVPAEELPAAMSAVQAGMTLAGIGAPALAGLLTGEYGASVPLLLDAATFAVVGGSAVLLRGCAALHPAARSTTASGAPQDGASGGMTGALAIVRQDRLLSAVFALLCAFVLIGCIVNVADVFLVRVALHASTTWYGVLGAIFSAGMLGGSVLAGRLRGERRLARAFTAAALVLASGLFGLGLAPGVLVAAVAGAVAGCGNGVLNVTLSALIMGVAAPDQRGRVGAALTATVSGTQLVALLIGGGLTAALGPRAVFVLAGALGAAVTAVLGRRVTATAQRAESRAMAAIAQPVP